jgi:hypothetical protein
MHKQGIGFTQEEIIKQVKDNLESVSDFKTYVPIGDAANKLRTWFEQGLEVLYLTSRTQGFEIAQIAEVLEKNNFPNGVIVFHQNYETYKDIVERILPDILIEDDCESIGGKDNLSITHVTAELKRKIKSIIVKEFSGIDHLPDNITSLREY